MNDECDIPLTAGLHKDTSRYGHSVFNEYLQSYSQFINVKVHMNTHEYQSTRHYVIKYGFDLSH
jgi:hypothetical protein